MKKTLSKPTIPAWQIGHFAPEATFRFTLPQPFLLLCRLLDTTPEQLLLDFIDNLSSSSRNREGRDKAKVHLVDYIIAHGYGQPRYREEDIRRMFTELDAVGLLFPRNGSDELIDLYTQWREEHYGYWFNQWQGKPERNRSF